MAGGKIVGRLRAILGLDKSNYDKGLKAAEKKASGFGKTIGKLGGILAGAFAVNKLVEFGKEAGALAAKAEGIRDAYSKIDDSNIESLRKSVKGTVSDMELMRNTVVATTLGLEASSMPELFAFAAQRANETGESVQFLVDSIVKGIGRKSPLILDNLGISAIALKEAMGGLSLESASVADVTKAVAKIAKEATGGLDELGNVTLTTAQKQQQLEASVGNLKVEIGNLVNAIVGELAPALSKMADAATTGLQDLNTIVASDKVSAWDKFTTIAGVLTGNLGAAEKATNLLTTAQDGLNEELKETNGQLETSSQLTPAVTKNVAWYKAEIDKLKESLDKLLPSQEAEAAQINETIGNYQSLIKGITQARTEIENVAKAKGIDIGIDSEAVKAQFADVTKSFISQQQLMRLEKQNTVNFWSQLDDGYYTGLFEKANLVLGAIGQIMGNLSAMYLAQKESEIAAAEAQAKAQGKSEEWLAKKKDSINKKYAKKEKNLAIAMAIINTAQGVTKALAQGGTVGIILGALVAAAGAVQISQIQSQGLAKGGIIPPGFPNDTFPAMLTSGEAVIPAKKLPEMTGGGQREELVTRLKGQYIEIVLQRWDKEKARIT